MTLSIWENIRNFQLQFSLDSSDLGFYISSHDIFTINARQIHNFMTFYFILNLSKTQEIRMNISFIELLFKYNWLI